MPATTVPPCWGVGDPVGVELLDVEVLGVELLGTDVLGPGPAYDALPVMDCEQEAASNNETAAAAARRMETDERIEPPEIFGMRDNSRTYADIGRSRHDWGNS
jgi:hypothetical protein